MTDPIYEVNGLMSSDPDCDSAEGCNAVARQQRAEAAFEHGRFELALELYSGLIKDEKSRVIDAPLPEIVRWHLNCAAILISLEKWTHVLQACRVLLSQFESFLVEHQLTRVHYFKCICCIRLSLVKEGREAITMVFKSVRRNPDPLDSDEAVDYQDAERAVCSLERRSAISMFAELSWCVHKGDNVQALKVSEAGDVNLGPGAWPYDYYCLVSRARLAASSGQLDKAVEWYKRAASINHVSSLEKELLLVTAGFFMSLSRNPEHKKAAGELFTAVEGMDVDVCMGSLIEVECHHSVRSMALLKCAEVALATGELTRTVQYLIEVVDLVQYSATDAAGAHTALWLPAANCSCSSCALTRFISLENSEESIDVKSMVSKLTSSNILTAKCSELCSTLSLCGWREMRVLEASTYMTAVVHLWRCYADKSEEAGKLMCPSNLNVDRSFVWRKVFKFFPPFPVIAESNGAANALDTASLAYVASSSYKQLLSYINMLSIRLLHPVSVAIASDDCDDRIKYSVMVSDLKNMNSAVLSMLSSGCSGFDGRVSDKQRAYRYILEYSGLVDLAVKLNLSVASGLMLHLGVKPFFLTQEKPDKRIRNSSMLLHCNLDNVVYEDMLNDEINIISKAIDLVNSLVDGALIKLVFGEGGAVSCKPNTQNRDVSKTIVQRICGLLAMLVRLHYNLGITVWHHEEHGLSASIRHFDKAVDSERTRTRLCAQFGPVDTFGPSEANEFFVLIGDVYFHLANAVLSAGLADSTSQALAAITSSICCYDTCFSADRVRRKHAWSLKCIVEGLLGKKECVEECFAEIRKVVLPPMEDPEVEIRNIKRKLAQVCPDMYPIESNNLHDKLNENLSSLRDRGRSIMRGISDQSKACDNPDHRNRRRESDGKGGEGRADMMVSKAQMFFKDYDKDLIIAYSILVGIVVVVIIPVGYFIFSTYFIPKIR